MNVGSGVAVGAGDGANVGLRSFFMAEEEHLNVNHARKNSDMARMRGIVSLREGQILGSVAPLCWLWSNVVREKSLTLQCYQSL